MTTMGKTKKISNGNENLFEIVRLVEKKFGRGSILRCSVKRADPGPGVSTGSFSLDCALGGLGLPFGRVVELYGPESSGKTTLALHIIANAQKSGYVAAMIDAEHAMDIVYAKKLHVNLGKLLLAQPDYGEQALGICISLIKTGVKVIVVDSVAALTPKAELDGEMGDQQIGLQARMMAKALRKLIAIADRYKVLIVFINQTRSTIGGFSRGGETTPGGKALKFYASVRMEIKRIKTEKVGEKAVANLVVCKVVKSKICAPFRSGIFVIRFNKGIDKYEEIFMWAKKCKVLRQKGATYIFGDLKAKGKKRFIQALKDDARIRTDFVSLTKKAISEKF